MTSERLRANTPKRWAESNPALTWLKYFVLLFLSFSAVTLTAFLTWYLVNPLQVKVFINRLVENLR
jgi:uncharacterized membrane protein